MYALALLLVVWYFTGSVLLFTDENQDSASSERKKRDVKPEEMFMFYGVLTIDNFEQSALFGYSVSSGKFLLPDVTHYAAGAPHAANSFGKASCDEILCCSSSNYSINQTFA